MRNLVILVLIAAPIGYLTARQSRTERSDSLVRAMLAANGKEELTDAELGLFYQGFDDTYFDGKLPNIPVHYSDAIEAKDGAIAETLCTGTTPGSCEILIASQLKGYSAVVLEAELHEVCHVARTGMSDINPQTGLQDNHGPGWNTCMKRLANADAFEGIW